MGTVLTYQPHRLHIFDRFFNKFHLKDTMPSAPASATSVGAGAGSRSPKSMAPRAGSGSTVRQKRLQQAPQLPDPALQEQTVEECGNSTLMIHQELKLAQFLFWLCRCCSLHQSSCCTSGENTHALKWIINEGPC